MSVYSSQFFVKLTQLTTITFYHDTTVYNDTSSICTHLVYLMCFVLLFLNWRSQYIRQYDYIRGVTTFHHELSKYVLMDMVKLVLMN